MVLACSGYGICQISSSPFHPYGFSGSAGIARISSRRHTPRRYSRNYLALRSTDQTYRLAKTSQIFSVGSIFSKLRGSFRNAFRFSSPWGGCRQNFNLEPPRIFKPVSHRFSSNSNQRFSSCVTSG